MVNIAEKRVRTLKEKLNSEANQLTWPDLVHPNFNRSWSRPYKNSRSLSNSDRIFAYTIVWFHSLSHHVTQGFDAPISHTQLCTRTKRRARTLRHHSTRPWSIPSKHHGYQPPTLKCTKNKLKRGIFSNSKLEFCAFLYLWNRRSDHPRGLIFKNFKKFWPFDLAVDWKHNLLKQNVICGVRWGAVTQFIDVCLQVRSY